MISNSMTQSTPATAQFGMPEGTFVRSAWICADVEVYVKGTIVFADAAAIADDAASTAAARPRVLDLPGVRTWSPPV